MLCVLCSNNAIYRSNLSLQLTGPVQDLYSGSISLLAGMSSSVQVNDERGLPLGKVKVGETKLKALERLSHLGKGGLFDKDDVGLLDDDLINKEGAPYVFKKSEALDSPKTRFRRLAESAAINVTEPVMKNLVLHFASQMTVVTTAQEAADLYKRASRIPGSATEIELQEENISVGEICAGTDTSKSIILEAFEDGSPCLLKITERESIDHEISVWEAVNASSRDTAHLVPLRKLEFKKTANVQVKNLARRYADLPGDYKAGILMQKYQSTLSRCKIPLTESVLLRYGEQLKAAICTMHECGYCHMDIKPSNIFLSGGNCYLGDYGGATRIGEVVREHTLSYYPSNADRFAKKETDFLLLAVTLLEMFGTIPSPPAPMTVEEITAAVIGVGNENVRVFLRQLVERET